MYSHYSPDNTACLWDINSSTLLLKYTGHTGSGGISHDFVVVTFNSNLILFQLIVLHFIQVIP